MKKSTTAILITFSALVLVAGVSVLVGVLTHNEPVYIENVPRWERDDFPLWVMTRTYTVEPELGTRLPSGDHATAIETAIDWANHRLGFTAFAGVESPEDTRGPLVSIIIGVPHEPGWMDASGTSRLHHNDGHASICDIATSNVGSGETLVLVLYHELGHCLGLAHDDFSQSIMYPTIQSPWPSGTIPPWISDVDRSRLRADYAPR